MLANVILPSREPVTDQDLVHPSLSCTYNMLFFVCSITSTAMQNTYCTFALVSFRDLFVAGEHMDKDTMSWTRKAISAPVYDNWWQTGRVILDLLTDLVIKIIYLSIK